MTAQNAAVAVERRGQKAGRGFTLIELSIVLVIIGLIVGGVLVGTNLIYAARLQKAASSITQLNSAAQTFRTKYDCLPGDCANATTFFGVWNGATGTWNGNGDGVIGMYGFNYQANGVEANLFWQHLYLAGLSTFNITYSGGYVAFSGGVERCNFGYPCFLDDGTADLLVAGGADNAGDHANVGPNYWWISSDYSAPASGFHGALYPSGVYAPLSTNQPGLIPSDAYAIDTKIDDGLPLTGNMQDVLTENYLYALPDTTSNQWGCTTALGVNTYNVSNTANRACLIRIQAGF